MGIENEEFIDFPFKEEYVDEDDILYYSLDETEDPVSPNNFLLMPSPAIMVDEFIDDEEDEEYDPADDEYFLSDSDIFTCETDEYESSLGAEEAYFSDSNDESVESQNTSQDNSKETEEKLSVPTPSQARSSSAPPRNNETLSNP